MDEDIFRKLSNAIANLKSNKKRFVQNKTNGVISSTVNKGKRNEHINIKTN